MNKIGHSLAGLLVLLGMALSAPAAAAPPAGAAMTAPCTTLNGMKIASDRIGLPTTGGEVTAAELIEPRSDGPHPYGAHCKISGAIRPVDPQSSNIRFEIRLPAQWNGKSLMLGGGGFEGTIPKIDESPYNSLPGSPSALARGYAIFGNDGGHEEDPAAPGKFLLNDEAYLNWMGDAIKKTRDAALAVIEAAYGRKASKSYFVGGSSGGREGLIAAARWPADWDGVVSLYPARNQMVEIVGGLGINRAFAEPGAYSQPEQRAALLKAALQACDALDGIQDGVISAVRRCNARFDPMKATIDGKPLRCPKDAPAGGSCLTDAQLGALAVMEKEQRFGFALAGGDSKFPGYNVYTSDTGVLKDHPAQQMLMLLSLGLRPPAYPAAPGMSLMATFGDNFVRYGIARDAGVNPLNIGPGAIGPYQKRIVEMSKLDVPERDLSSFAARGGKLIVMHGAADMIVSPRNSVELYKTLQANMGKPAVARFMRYYEVPGFAHAVSTTFNAAWDYLSALENWVENGKDPGNGEIVADVIGVPGRTRPLCQYPTWPKYKGTGDANQAASFACASE